MTNQLPAVFIGSSSEGLDIAREVELHLLNVALVNLWTNGIFVLGEGTLESLVNALDNFDFAIMVLSPDDLLETRGQNFASPRDNVLFELGLFMGRLGRRRTIILSEEGVDLKLPSDLADITRATYRKHNNQPLSVAVSPACTRIIQAIRSQGKLERSDPDQESPGIEFERMAQHINNYLVANQFSMVTFERIRKNINPKYSDELLLEMIDRRPDKFRRVRMKEGKPGVGFV
jgi:Predicted nucleotide-binding protein containing TIR-like domain